MQKFLNYFKKFDWILFFSVLILLSLGLAEIYSIALGQETLSLLNFKKQIAFILIGIILLFVFSLLDYHFLKTSSVYLFIFGVATLVIVLFFGSTIRGTKGWFSVAGFGVQPVEIIKIILILFLAYMFEITFNLERTGEI